MKIRPSAAFSNLTAFGILGIGLLRARFFFYRKIKNRLHLPAGTQLNAREQRRLQHYFYGVSYLNIIFCSLLGRRRTVLEKDRAAQMAALAAFFDDLSDRAPAQHRQSPEAYGAAHDARGLALHWLKKVEASFTPEGLRLFRRHLDAVFKLESSGRQSGRDLGAAELQQISTEKGARSVLLFRSLLEPAAGAAESEALGKFGALIQLCDDVFDLWFDRQAGIPTLPGYYLEKTDVAGLSRFFEQTTAEAKAAFQAINGVKSRLAWSEVQFIVNITRVCLSHYRDLAKKHGTLPLESRKDMVVDMEKWKNRLLTARYFFWD